MTQMPDAYTSVEAVLYEWFAKQGLWPGKLGRGDIQDLVVRISGMIEPFRTFFRATESPANYDMIVAREKAQAAEKAF